VAADGECNWPATIADAASDVISAREKELQAAKVIFSSLLKIY
jgi:hypothetical protein